MVHSHLTREDPVLALQRLLISKRIPYPHFPAFQNETILPVSDRRTVSYNIRRCAVVARGCNTSHGSVLYMSTVGNRDSRVLFRSVRVLSLVRLRAVH